MLIRGTLLIPPDAGPLAVAPDVLYQPPCLKLPSSFACQPHGNAGDLGPRYNYPSLGFYTTEISKAARACSRDGPFEFIHITASSLTSGRDTPLNSAIRAVLQKDKLLIDSFVSFSLHTEQINVQIQLENKASAMSLQYHSLLPHFTSNVSCNRKFLRKVQKIVHIFNGANKSSTMPNILFALAAHSEDTTEIMETVSTQ